MCVLNLLNVVAQCQLKGIDIQGPLEKLYYYYFILDIKNLLLKKWLWENSRCNFIENMLILKENWDLGGRTLQTQFVFTEI